MSKKKRTQGFWIDSEAGPIHVRGDSKLLEDKKFMESMNLMAKVVKSQFRGMKHCPFCGGRVEFHQVETSGENHITCDGCGVKVTFDVDLTEEQVKEKWNTRALIEHAEKDRESIGI